MARDFDGIDDYADDPTVTNVGAGSITAWIRADELPATTDRDVICSFYQSGQNEPFTVHDKQFFIDPSGIVTFRVFEGAVKTVVSTTAISPGTWYHIGVLYGRFSDCRIFINGIKENTLLLNNDTYGYTDPAFRICGIPRELGDGETTITRFNGQIADWCIFDEPLDDVKMTALARGVSPHRVAPGNLVRYWPLLGTGSPEPDLSGNSNITLSGPPLVADGPPVGPRFGFSTVGLFDGVTAPPPTGRIMSSLVAAGGLAGSGGIAGSGGGLAG